MCKAKPGQIQHGQESWAHVPALAEKQQLLAPRESKLVFSKTLISPWKVDQVPVENHMSKDT